MKKMHFGRRLLAMLLVAVMVMSMAACGKETEKDSAQKADNTVQLELPPVADPSDPESLSREDKELIAELLGDGEDPHSMTDEELNRFVEKLIGEEKPGGIVNLNNQEKEKLPVLETGKNPDVYNGEGAMTIPFDQAYPQVIEQGQVKFSGETILVKLASGKLTTGLKAAGVGALKEIVPLQDCAWYEAKLTEGTDAGAALEAVRALPETLLAEYNYEIQTAALDDYKHFDDETDKEFQKNGHNKDQWHQHHCGIPDGYKEMETEGGDPSVIVAVIDSGVDYDHEDLKDNMWVNAGEIPDNNRDDDGNGYVDDYYGIDLIAGKGNADDDNGHGTHVAGIVAGVNNNTGVVGIAYNVKIMPIKAAMHNGTLNQGDIAEAVLYAYSMGAEVINMSFGGTACSIAVQDALATAYTRCVLVASAGNNGKPNEKTDYMLPLPSYPAALSYVLGVMSVDENGVESVFTNWDAFAYNGVEYEVYAPGENIMSTLPDNRYGYLSGTSMAAPIVSSFAAILRSEFADRDKYPTKFIYGQLASTSEYYAECIDPKTHAVGGQPHNLPQIVDLNAALTKLPKPEVNLNDYAIFDSKDLSSKNNGDGVIDAGETIALGLTLRNRWGMSENTRVTVDTLVNGIADPYISIVNPAVNYGSVGTYSTGDCGKVFTDGLHTGWEEPFLLKIADNCPNDYRFTLNITIRCENALDEGDKTVYTSRGTIDSTVRAGFILPSIIEEDMVLTPDNLYIIPNATVIQQGVTVRVQPGTHIQFWSDDASDPYASDYIAYLLVNGKFLVEGTKENPVYIYPSQLMDRYGVEIGASGTGYASLKYADVTNFMYGSDHTGTGNRIDMADHCTFRNNYGDHLNYRYLDGGRVRSSSTNYLDIGSLNAKDCVFYKLGMSGKMDLRGSFDRCIFVQCGIQFYQGYAHSNTYYGDYKNCVFLDNAFVDQTRPSAYTNSAITANSIQYEYIRVLYRPETGTTYISAYDENGLFRQFLAETLELETVNYAILETQEEAAWLADQWRSIISYSTYSEEHYVGLRYDEAAARVVWSDGSPMDSSFDPDGVDNGAGKDYYLNFYNEYKNSTYTTGVKLGRDNRTVPYNYPSFYELPGKVLPTDITFAEYTVDMDPETTYQIVPQNTPVQLPTSEFRYESSDEAVLTVSNTGLVTPTGMGTADVWVWSLDRAVRNRITFTVREYVPLTGMAFPAETLRLEKGKSVYAPCILTPADTTRHNVTYTTSDPSVVTVENGMLTAVDRGTATVTATCEGLTATLQVRTFVKATRLTYAGNTDYYTRTVEALDTSLPAVEVYPANADLDLVWTSGDPEYVTVENGKLIAKKSNESLGNSVVITAKDQNSGLSTKFYFRIKATAPVIQKDVIAAQLGAEPVALPGVTLAEGAAAEPVWTLLDPAVAEVKDGMVHFNSAGVTTLRVTDPRNGLTDRISIYVTQGAIPRVKDVIGQRDGYNVWALMEDGSAYWWDASSSTMTAPQRMEENVKSIWLERDSYYAALLLENGTLKIYYGQSVQATVTLPEALHAAAVTGYYNRNSSSGSMHLLDEDGKVYAMGYNTYGILGTGTTENHTEWTLVSLPEPVVQVAHYNAYMAYYLTESGKLYVSGGSNLLAATPVMVADNVTWLDDHGQYYVSNEKLYAFTYSATEPVERTQPVAGCRVLDVGYDDYVLLLQDGKLYYGGVNSSSRYSCLPHLTNAMDAFEGYYGDYVVTEEGFLFGYGSGNYNSFIGMAPQGTYQKDIFLPIVRPEQQLTLLETNLEENGVLTKDALELRFNKELLKATVTVSESGTAMVAHKEINLEMLQVAPILGFTDGTRYTVTITVNGTAGYGLVAPAGDIVVEFTYQAPEIPEEETPEPEQTPEEALPEQTPEEPVVYEAIVDETIQRRWTAELLTEAKETWRETYRLNPFFYGNAILNPISTDTNVEHWLRFQAPSVNAGVYSEVNLAGNWWGTTNERAIGLQMIDYTDFISYARLMYAPYLTQAPENTFPFVTSVKLFNGDGEEVTTVGNEEITFQVKFNRDMDTTIPLLVRFGSAYPYGDYEIEGQYVDARTWEGTYTLNTLIENGNQYFTISNGCSATDDLELQLDQQRFGFVIDTTAAQALIMQGNATDTGIELRWTQDDFDTLMGYNVYRSTAEDGLYTRINKTVIPADTMTFFDDTVEPGVVYYYNFTVVKTDLTESEPSGKINIMSKDTMAPNIYHSPVSGVFTGSNLVLSATITDNLNIAYANLYYRVTGTESWNTVRMNKLNDKYSAIIPAQYVTLAGLEYYIEAFDGVSYTYKGSAETPYTVSVQASLDARSLGDVDGDGTITNLDALLLLYAINDKYNLTAEQFARADLNGDGVLWAAEALRILQYVSGKVGSVQM